ncbi:hypothetical protein SRAA_1003 [Serpentinimonas raichei]|jgi:hypothetical protein|uniref:Transcriptional regulator, AbiEi antitoxin, Type IV TA system n=1 Tax=Serpentinimonas raichei TaxID=1458425 RepID=A0A060NI18_9BURK|nr:hypothetical protein [Serpentinimonas raichei]BAO80857.1 hypothetical protein SRAA_1003 [Serpentinimonas raichei]
MFAALSSSSTGLRGAAAQLANVLEAGRVYRREDLSRLSTAVDRHLRELVAAGKLKKLAQGLYHVPKQSSLGALPPADEQVVGVFLKDKDFLVFSPSAYNALGLGTTQLYNRTLVYNHKRHGVFKLGNRQFDFRVKPRFPKKLTPEFLYVDLLNNLDELAEDRDAVLRQARSKLSVFDSADLQRAIDRFGSLATRKRVREWTGG